MDPRHPEQAISRMRELMKQYDRIEADMAKATTSAQLAQLEREGGLVVQEICLVAPRIHEAMMQTSRQRRHDLSSGVVKKPVEKSFHRADVVTEIEDPYKVEGPVEKSAQSMTEQSTEPMQSVEETEVKPKKKTTRKKKTAKKADK